MGRGDYSGVPCRGSAALCGGKGYAVTLPPPGNLLARLPESVELIAAEPADQEHWYASTGFPVDEIAEQFHDDVLVLWQLQGATLMTPERVTALRALDDHFGSFSGPANAARWQMNRFRLTGALAVDGLLRLLGLLVDAVKGAPGPVGLIGVVDDLVPVLRRGPGGPLPGEVVAMIEWCPGRPGHWQDPARSFGGRRSRR